MKIRETEIKTEPEGLLIQFQLNNGNIEAGYYKHIAEYKNGKKVDYEEENLLKSISNIIYKTTFSIITKTNHKKLMIKNSDISTVQILSINEHIKNK